MGSLVEKFGPKVGGILMCASGIAALLPAIGVSPMVSFGIGMLGGGIGVLAFGTKWTKSDDNFAISEAEKRISSPMLPSTSAVPAIQAEIVKQKSEGSVQGQ